MSVMRLASALGLAVLLACARAPSGAGEGASPDELVDVRRTGTVAILGSTPTEWVALRPDAGAPLRLEGEMAADLRRLAGARVAVEGRGSGDVVQVEAYEVLSVDGRPVISGRVEPAPGGGLQLVTPAGQIYHLHDPPASVRAGQRIWIQGPASVRVQRYGSIGGE